MNSSEIDPFAPSRHVMVTQTNYITLELDVDVFENENQARMLRGDHGYEPRTALEWQYAGFPFSIGFVHKCGDCGREGPRKDFNEGEAPPWKCPKCKSSRVFQKLPLQSERLELPEVIANHAFNTQRTYPNKITNEGQVLVAKDTSKLPVRFLKKVSRVRGEAGEPQSMVKQFACTFCGDEFPTLKLLHTHRVEAHGMGGGALAEVPKPGEKTNGITAAQAVPVLAPKPVPAAAAPQPEPVSGSESEPEPETPARKSPAELKAALDKAKTKGAKAGDAATE